MVDRYQVAASFRQESAPALTFPIPQMSHLISLHCVVLLFWSGADYHRYMLLHTECKHPLVWEVKQQRHIILTLNQQLYFQTVLKWRRSSIPPRQVLHQLRLMHRCIWVLDVNEIVGKILDQPDFVAPTVQRRWIQNPKIWNCIWTIASKNKRKRMRL